MAAEAEAPVDPAITTSLKEANELVQKLIEEGRESRKDVDHFKGALAKNSEELKAARTEKKAISDKIEQLKKERYDILGREWEDDEHGLDLILSSLIQRCCLRLHSRKEEGTPGEGEADSKGGER